MALATFSDLKGKVAGYLARSGMDAQISDAIAMFEAQYNGAEDNYFAEMVGTITTTAGTSTASLPSDFNQHVALYYDDGQPVELVDISALNPINVAGRPTKAAIFPGNRLKFDVVPAAAYALEIVYEAKLSPLSDTNATNWLMLQYPNVYVYGSLMFMLDYLQDSIRADTVGKRAEGFLLAIQGKKPSKKLGNTPKMQVGRGCP